MNYCALGTVYEQENLPEEFNQTSVLVLCLLVVNLGRLQGDSRTKMLKIIDRYGHVHNCREVNVVIVARRLLIADTRWW